LHYQVEGEVFDEVICAVAEGLAIEGVKNRMASTVSSSSAAVSLSALAVFERLATERTLVDLALLRPGERDTVVFKLRLTGVSAKIKQRSTPIPQAQY
jgi:hypothetical protein